MAKPLPSEYELLKKVRGALKANTDLRTLLGATAEKPKIYNHVSPDRPMPYVVVGIYSEEEFDTDDTEGGEHLVTISCWSDYQGQKESMLIINQCHVTLENFHKTNPSMEHHDLVNFTFQFKDNVREPDGQTYQGLIQYRAVTQEK